MCRQSHLRAAVMRLLAVIGLIGSLILCAASHATAEPNIVAQYLAHADRQYETEDQRMEMVRALEDMLTKAPDKLRALRYADYQGNKDAWSLPTLLQRYFVPVKPVPRLDSDAFFRDVAKPVARQSIREQLSALKNEGGAH